MGPLIGRKDELAQIASALHVGSVVLTAPAGVGKSRLAREAITAQARDGALTDWVQATRSAAEVPFAAFAGLLPYDVRSDDVAQLMRRSTEALIERARGRRIVLGVDDAQLLDGSSAALVLHVANQGVRILATVRAGERVPDAITALSTDRSARHLELPALRYPEVGALIESTLDGPVEAAAVSWFARTSQGNPLFVQELLAVATQTGALDRVDGLWCLLRRPPASASLRDLIASRLEDLSTEQHRVIELLSLCEPLSVDELTDLTSHATLLELERRQLIVVDDTDLVRLAHPLFGEVVGGGVPQLRARELRARLVETLQRRDPRTPDDALRIARLLLDAGLEIPRDVCLDAARAAISAGDPDLGAELAQRSLAHGGLEAALLLAQAHVMRNRVADAEAVFADAEALAAGHPRAFEYLKARTANLYWGLRRLHDGLAVVERAARWSPDPEWAEQVLDARRAYGAIAGGFDVSEGDGGASADGIKAMAALFGGDGEAATRIARRSRPRVLPRSPVETGVLAASSVVAVETGYGWEDTGAYMDEMLLRAVAADDRQAAGIAAMTLGSLEFLRGRYRDAARRLTEAQHQLTQHDTFGMLVHVHAYKIGAAAAVNDFDGVATGLADIDAVLEGREPLPAALPYLLRAQGWATRIRSPAEAGHGFLAGSARLDRIPIHAAHLAYEAMRAGAAAAPRLHEIGPRCKAPLVDAYVAHADARLNADAPALLYAAESFASIGALRYAMEAAAEAATQFLRAGRHDSARRAAARANELHQPDQGTAPPTIDGLDGTATALTQREAQIVDLARQGLSNAQIAERLVVSRRTIEGHIYNAMYKLGVNDRHLL